MKLQHRLCAAALVATVLAPAVWAQQYPARPVRIIVPFGAGTGADLAARILGERLGKSRGQTFIVDNRAGAGGAIGTKAVATAAPDGYTLLSNASSHTSLPALKKSLPFDARRDFAGIAAFATSPMILVAAKSRNWRSVQDLVAAAKARPGTVSFASAGTGSTTHLSTEKFRLDAGFEAIHVPYKSTTDALADVIAGRVDFLITSVPPTLGPIKDARIVALAIGQKSGDLPNVPSFADAGIRESQTWFGLFAPARTPREIVQRLHDEVVKASGTAEVRERLARIGAEPAVTSIEEFNALVLREIADNEKLIGRIGLKAD